MADDSDDDDLFDAPDPVDPDSVEVRVSVRGMGPGDTRLFGFRRDREDLDGIVVARDDGFAVFVNRCPHALFTLDVGDGHVTSRDRKNLVCWMHGAVFDMDSGRCVLGPGRGRSLEPLPHELDGDCVVVAITPEPEGWPRTPPNPASPK